MQGMPEEQLALPLLVMLAQQRRFIAVQSQTGPLKLIAELYDKAQESLYLVRQHIGLSFPVLASKEVTKSISNVAFEDNCLIVVIQRMYSALHLP